MHAALILFLLGGVPYDCQGLGPFIPHTQTHGDDAVSELVEAWHPRELGSYWKVPSLKAALIRVRAVDPDTLPLEERIWAQNIALSVTQQTTDKQLKRLAGEVAHQLALAPEVFAAIGSEPDRGIGRWLGVSGDWTERRANRCGRAPLHHEVAYRGVRAFRPVENGETRGLISQLIALDTNGKAHVTPVVGGIEIRTGFEVDAPACVVELDVSALRAGEPAGLVAMPVTALHKTLFIRPSGDGTISCNGCHKSDSSMGMDSVTGIERWPLLDSRREVVEKFATDRLSPSVLETILGTAGPGVRPHP